jgi:hypothetical protein
LKLKGEGGIRNMMGRRSIKSEEGGWWIVIWTLFSFLLTSESRQRRRLGLESLKPSLGSRRK